MNPLAAHRQASYDVRLEWGPSGAAAVVGGGDGADLVVVVDVLSFSTTVTVAVERGICVVPARWSGPDAAELTRRLAREHDAVVAVGRLEGRERPGLPSLSPAAMSLVEGVPRLVLPSPNGSTIAHLLSQAGVEVVAGCLRNASAVGAHLARHLAPGGRVGVVAAGERWPDDTLRPAAEDLWGAGAVLAALPPTADLSPEAALARTAWAAVADDVPGALAACASGRELVEAGFGDDVAVAAELDVASVVPVLAGGTFRPVAD